MNAAGKFVPIRFLALVAHFVILVTLLWSLDSQLLSCLYGEYTQDDRDNEKQNLTIGLSFGIGCFGIEIISFLMGVSMFKTFIAMTSTFCHVSASVTLSLFILEEWECYRYWYIFGFCSVLPVVLEIIAIILFALGKRK